MAKRKFSGRWFVTAAAVEDYMRLCGEDIDDPAAFDRAAGRLKSLCRQSRFTRSYSGGQYENWRVNADCGGRKIRLNLSVSLRPNEKGYSDQLVAVSDNDARRR